MIGSSSIPRGTARVPRTEIQGHYESPLPNSYCFFILFDLALSFSFVQCSSDVGN